MITDMDVNPDHPLAAQAFTLFRVPAGLVEFTLIAMVGLAGYTLWEAVTARGTFASAPGLLRGAAVAGIIYVAARCVRPALNRWRRQGGTGPAIERIEP